MNLAGEREKLEQWTEEKRQKLLSCGSDHKAARAEIERIREELWYEGERVKNGFKKLSLRDDYSLLGAALRPVSEKHQVFGELIKEVVEQFEFEPTLEKRVSQRLFDDPYGHWKVWSVLLLFLIGAGAAWFILDILGIGTFVDKVVGLPPIPQGRYINPYHIIFYFIVGILWAMPGAHRVLTPRVNKGVAIGLLVGTGLFASLFITKPSGNFQFTPEQVQSEQAQLITPQETAQTSSSSPGGIPGKAVPGPGLVPGAVPGPVPGRAVPGGTVDGTPLPTASSNSYQEWAESEFRKFFNTYFTQYNGRYYILTGSLTDSFIPKYKEYVSALIEIQLVNGGVVQEGPFPADEANGISWRGRGTILMQSVRYLAKGEGWSCYTPGPYKSEVVFYRWQTGKTQVAGQLQREPYSKPTVEEIKEALAKPANQDCA